ncbi:solid-state culture specific ATP-grasp domain protein [Aspergillus bombycis]|uniref:Solid-state culture specific ATP-grasp domain protein n=1 Tax=Aspergillus bombycis TaxID=109264 RepID=A0A1F8A9T8_9EURO|nr:solid-state culture specific ATP-grasp domain protein [Aspergillus bombycis]OGM48510.1 solid-state culture specific ATP-grasp domain protein [Aspergillus bombycis]
MDPAARITLDYTLRDLYSDNNEDDLNMTLIYYPLQFGYLHESSSAKYAYGYTLESDDEKAMSSFTMAANMVPQRYAFSAGQMPLVILDFDSTNKQKEANRKPCETIDELPVHHLDIRRTFSQLMPDQQPILTVAISPESISLDPGAQIAVLLPTDCMSHLPHVVHPETHYEILSKRGLALSGLPTPPSQVIDTGLVDSNDPTLVKQEVARMVESIDQRQVPFMVKLPQSVSGIGTFSITTDVERNRVKTLLTEQLGVILRQLNRSNHHLYPCSMVLQDFVAGPVVALSLFITKNGQARFISCCEQRFDARGHWIGGTISYRQQGGLRQTFATIMQKVADFLHTKGYHGPAGVDIVSDDHSGEQLVIDLNARVTGTFHLGPLMGHFTKRGLFEAGMTTGDFSCSRDTFEQTFADEIRNGSLIVSGWVHNESSRLSHAAITIGAREPDELKGYFERIGAFAVHS